MDSIIFTRIKELCKRSGISVNRLESIVGMSQYSITRWKNSSSPTVDKLLRVAQYFHVSLDYLVGQTDVSSPNPAIQAACDLTGLSEQSVVNLSELNRAEDPNSKNKLITIIQLIEDDGIEEWGCDLLQSLANYLSAEKVPYGTIQFTEQVSEEANILYNRILTDRVMRALEAVRHQFQQSMTMAEMCGPISSDILEKRCEEESKNGKPQDND